MFKYVLNLILFCLNISERDQAVEGNKERGEEGAMRHGWMQRMSLSGRTYKYIQIKQTHSLPYLGIRVLCI